MSRPGTTNGVPNLLLLVLAAANAVCAGLAARWHWRGQALNAAAITLLIAWVIDWGALNRAWQKAKGLFASGARWIGGRVSDALRPEPTPTTARRRNEG